MRIVIEQIHGKELAFLMRILERVEFGNKKELLGSWNKFLDDNVMKSHDSPPKASEAKEGKT